VQAICSATALKTTSASWFPGTVLILTPAVARIFLLFTSNLVIFKAFGV